MSYQEIIAKHNKMLEYFNFCLLCTLFALISYLYIQTKKYFPLFKMAEDIFSGYESPQSDTKRQELLECVLTGNSKLYLGKVYTEEQLKKLSKEEVEKQFNNYEAKLSGQMVKSLMKSIINMYSMGACEVLGISNQDALREDRENGPFLNSTLQRFTCKLYYRFSSFLAPLSIGIITSRHYLSQHNKNGEQERTSGTREGGDNENEQKPSKSESPMGPASGVIGSFLGMGIVGFCFGIMLAVKTVNNLEELIRR